MYWQREYVREAVSMTLGSTYKLTLPDHGLLGSILLRFSGSIVNLFGLGGGDWRIIDEISKIEVIGNGSTVIKSFTGYVGHALAALDQGCMPPSVWKNYSTATQWDYMLVNFGRKLFDEEMLLDLSKWDTVELWITNTAGASDFSGMAVSVVDFYLRDAPADAGGLGYLRTEEWRSWTVASDGTEYLELPTEHVLRRVLLQAIPPVDTDKIEKTNQWNLMDDISFGLDTGQVRVYKGGLDDLARENYFDLGKPMIATGSNHSTADKGVDISLGYVFGGAWGAGSEDGAGAGTIATYQTGRTSFTQKPETYEEGSPIGFIFLGVSPFLCNWFRFDQLRDPATWLDPNERKTVKLDIHSRSHADVVGGVNKVILDRLVTP